MRRNLRSYRNNPIDPAAAQELVSYVNGPNGGNLRVQFTGATGTRWDLMVSPVRVAKRETDGKMMLVVDNVRHPDGSTVQQFAGKAISIDLSAVDTMGYRAGNEPEPIVAATGAFRFLSPRFLRSLTVGDKKFVSVGQYLAYVGGTPKAQEKVLAEGEGFSFPSERMTASEFQTSESGVPSDMAVKTVTKLMFDKFSDVTMARLLATTGNRPIEIPEEIYGVQLAPLLTKIRSAVHASNTQPTGDLPSERLAVPEVGALSSEAEGFRIESEEEYEGRLRRISGLYEETRSTDAPEFVRFEVKGLRTDSEFDIDALVYIETGKYDDVINLRVLRECAIKLPYMTISYSAELGAGGGGISAVGNWVARHPEWKKIGIAYKGDRVTGPLDVFVAELIQELSHPQIRADYRERNLFNLRTSAGDLIIPFEGTITDVQRTATETRLKFLTDKTVPRLTFTTNEHVAALKNLKAFVQNLLNLSVGDLEKAKYVAAALGGQAVVTARFERFQSQLWRLVGPPSQGEKQTDYEEIPQTALSQALMAALERFKGTLAAGKRAELDEDNEAAQRKPKIDRMILEAEVERDAAASPEMNSLQSVMLYARALQGARATYNKLLKMSQDARRQYMEIRKMADQAVREGKGRGFAEDLERTMTGRLDELLKIEHDVDSPSEKSLKNSIERQIRVLGDLASESEMRVLQALTSRMKLKTEGAEYVYGGFPPTLLAQEVFHLPKDRTPVGQVLGREITPQSNVVTLSGPRDDVGPKKIERLTVDSMLLIYQEHGVTCEPVQVTHLQLRSPLTGRSKISELVNGVLGDYAKRARRLAIAAAMMGRKEKSIALDELSDELDERHVEDPSVENYVKRCREEAEKEYNSLMDEGLKSLPRKIASIRASMAKMRMTGEVDEEELVNEIKKAAMKQASYKMPDFSSAPVMYYILLNSVEKTAYTPDEVGIFPVSSPETAELLAREILTEYPQPAVIKKLAALPKFMSDSPLDEAQCALLRRLSRTISRALFEKVVPAAKAGKIPTYKDFRGNEVPVFAWDRPFYGVGAKSREAMATAKRLERVTGQAAGRLGGGPVGSVRVGRIRTRRGGNVPSVGTLTGGLETGRYKAGEAAMGVFTRDRSVSKVTSVQISGSKPRLSRMLDRLIDPKVPIEEKPVHSLNVKEAQMLRSRVRSKYGSEGDLHDIKDVQERAQERRKLQDNDNYLKPEDDLSNRLDNAREEVSEFLSDHNVSLATLDELDEEEREKFDSMQDNLHALEEDKSLLLTLEVMISQLTREGQLQRRVERIESSAGLGMRAVMALGRQPTVAELQAMQTAVLRGEDPMSVFQVKAPKANPFARRNAGEKDDDFSDLFAELGAEGESAPSAPPPPAAAPPSGEADRAAGGRLFESYFGQRAPEESIPDTEEITRLRHKTETAWSNFATALRSKGVKEALPALLSAYIKELTNLETALDQRDTAILQKEGERGREKLRDLLRTEAEASMRAVEAVYARADRSADGTISAAARTKFARDVGLMVDYMGRPIAPPSDEEMRSKGLVDQATGETFDIGTTKARELKTAVIRSQDKTRGPPSVPTKIMGPALNYAQLIEAGRLAARAEKMKAGGMSIGAISCKVMSSGQEVRRRINREVVNRIFDDNTYFGGVQTAAARRMASEKGKVLIWFSPDSSHAIFFVNNFGVCEFHADNVASLLMEVLHYTVDWFNDPRKGAERREYAVFVGRSGFPFIYMIWGGLFGASTDPRLSGEIVYQKDVSGPTSVEELSARLQFVGAFHSGGFANVPPDRKLAREVRQLVAAYISEPSASRSGYANLQAYLTEDANNYLSALVQAGYAASPKTAYSLLRQGPSALRAGSTRVMQILAKDAMEGKRKAVTLFYPALYGEGGKLLTSSGPTAQGPDANTGLILKGVLSSYAAAIPNNATVRIIDGSLFRKPVAQSMIVNASTLATMTQVPSPWATLRAEFTRLGKPDVKIELLVPPFTDLMPAFEEATAHVDGSPDVELVLGDRGTVYENLPLHISPGSTLVLWQDQDRADFDRVFGERIGALGIASAIAPNIVFIKRVVVEAGVHETETEIARPGDPAELREAVVRELATRIAQAGANLEQALAVLKIEATELPQLLKLKQGGLSAEELAEDVLRYVAGKYGVQPSEQFVYGVRDSYNAGSRTFTRQPVLTNRGRYGRR